MNIKDKLIHLLEGTGYTQKKVATKTGLSTAVISQYLKGVYNGNISNVESAIRSEPEIKRGILNVVVLLK